LQDVFVPHIHTFNVHEALLKKYKSVYLFTLIDTEVSEIHTTHSIESACFIQRILALQCHSWLYNLFLVSLA
jgi:hypothetical protein